MARNKEEIRVVLEQCRWRGLSKSALWLGEQLPGVTEDGKNVAPWQEASQGSGVTAGLERTEVPAFLLSKACFDNREYLRASHLLRNATSGKAVFLQLYSKYLAGEEKKQSLLANGADAVSVENPYCEYVHGVLSGHGLLEADPYLLWLYGVTLRVAKQFTEAKQVFVKSIALQPLLWCSWQELLAIGDISTALKYCEEAQIKSYWTVKFAAAKYFSQMHKWDKAMELLTPLGRQLRQAPAILQQIASVRRHMKQWRRSKEVFELLIELEPYRFDGIVEYSNVLFITRRAHLAELCQLARRAFSVAKYRPETCMVLADYHSAAERHDKAYEHYQRALKLDPLACRDSHILMGHEAIEMKLTGPAMTAYRNAVENCAKSKLAGLHNNEMLQKHCGSGWYGLGMAYEFFRLPCLTLLHYLRAVQQPASQVDQQPFWGGVGAMYEEIGMIDEAVRCYNRRVNIPEVVLHLARLARKQGKVGPAAEWYAQYLAGIKSFEPSSTQDSKQEDAQQEAFLIIAMNNKREVEEELAKNGVIDEQRRELLITAKQYCDTITMYGPSVETLSTNAKANQPAPLTIAPQQIYDTAEDVSLALDELIRRYNIPFKAQLATPKKNLDSPWAKDAEGVPTPGATRKLF
ncbi:Anaphase-promoting complex subunit 8 [Diplonema papillatum]|nr:Anaphase-promoting complex subunit 8 [Diplonema papillatum]